MGASADLTVAIQLSMGDLISAYDLDLVEVADDNVLLRGSTYAIDFFVDRDGVNMVYVETTDRPAKAYNLFLYLRARRGDQLVFLKNMPVVTTRADWLDLSVGSLVRHLRMAGHDILEGSKEWISSYPGDPLQPPSEIAGLI